MAEQNSITTPQENVPQAPLPAAETAKQELIRERTTSKWLALLFEEAFAGTKALCTILDDAEYDDTLAVLAPLVKHLETDLRRIEEVISSTLGKIDILVCTGPLIVDGREYREGDFYQATLTPKKARGGAGQLQ